LEENIEGIIMNEVKIGPYTIKLVPVDELEIAETNSRVIRSKDMFDEFVKNIDKRGLINFVWMTSKGKVYSGGQRLEAFRAGKTVGKDKFTLYKIDGKLYMPCVIYDCSEQEQRSISMSENFFHIPPSKDDVVNYVKQFQAEGWTLKQIAPELGLSAQELAKYLVHEELPQPVIEALGEDTLKKTSLRRDTVISRFAKIPHIREDEGLLKEYAKIALDLPVDIGEAYSKFTKMGLPTKHEAQEVINHPDEYTTLQMKLPKELYGRWMAYMIAKQIYTPMTFLIKAIELVMQSEPIDE